VLSDWHTLQETNYDLQHGALLGWIVQTAYTGSFRLFETAKYPRIHLRTHQGIVNPLHMAVYMLHVDGQNIDKCKNTQSVYMIPKRSNTDIRD